MVDGPDSIYHVPLEGRTVGTYDRRTIIGMRINKALRKNHVLVKQGGGQLTVADLIEARPEPRFNPNRSVTFSKVKTNYTDSLIETQSRGLPVPSFKGELEVRVQRELLRVAGSCRRGLGWKDVRIKIALADVAHLRVQGSRVDLWLRNRDNERLQRIALELFMPETATELAGWLPAATPPPDGVDSRSWGGWRSRSSSGKRQGAAVPAGHHRGRDDAGPFPARRGQVRGPARLASQRSKGSCASVRFL
jgi:hypothetical protein